MTSRSGYINPTFLRLWKKRKEVYVGYMDGTISVYTISKNSDGLEFSANFKAHSNSIFSLWTFDSLNFLVTSGLDSNMKMFRPPSEWVSRKFRSFIYNNTPSIGKDTAGRLSVISNNELHQVLEHCIKDIDTSPTSGGSCLIAWNPDKDK